MLTVAAFALLIGKKIYSCAASLAFSFSIACTDEWLQTFVEGRAGSYSDVLIDVFGAAAGIIVVSLTFIMIRASHRKNQLSNQS